MRLRLDAGVRPVTAPTPVTDHTRPVTLFLPARNEAPRVGAVLARCPQRVAGHPVRRVVVDDASSDDTAAVAARAGAHVIRFGSHRGLGAAVRVGIADAVAHDSAAVAFCDADGEYAPEELEALVTPLLRGTADYVVGSRFLRSDRDMRVHRELGNRALTTALRYVARTAVSDGQSGYRALSPRAAALAEIAHDYNYAQVLTLDLVRKGMRYAEVPISYAFRSSGRSYIRLGRYLRNVVPATLSVVNSAGSAEASGATPAAAGGAPAQPHSLGHGLGEGLVG